ncbi:MAG: TonB-dependent receptor [Elusimicrobia bacterium]|nr:TonB-dependent receptor [Candidatus Liberimonas magnetica]
MKRTIAVVLGSVFCFANLSFAEEVRSVEELMFMDISVMTASKKAQSLSDAPATVSVITSENIENSSALTIPDLLKMVPGMEVMAFDERDQQVSIRGFNGVLSNKLLVMIDGRSVYWDAYGYVFWPLMQVGLEEIDRIEIIRGPSSSLYGANAYCGLINIITKKPEQIAGTHVSLIAGNRNILIPSVMNAWVGDKVSYKVSGEWNRMNKWQDDSKSAGDISKGNAFVEYKYSENQSLALSAGRSHVIDYRFFLGEDLGSANFTGDLDYMRFDWSYKTLQFRTYYKEENAGSILNIRSNENKSWKGSSLDAEIQHSIDLASKHSILWGVNGRYNRVISGGYVPALSQSLWAVFAEDQFKPSDKLLISVGGRYDMHPLVKETISPRGSIAYNFDNNNTLRLSASKAFRQPSLVQSYIDWTQNGTYSVALIPGVSIPYTSIVRGNSDLKAEGIKSVEIGYLNHGKERFKMSANVFYNQYDEFITVTSLPTYYDANDLFPGSPGGLLTKQLISSYANAGKADGYGSELEFNLLVIKGLSAVLNYSYITIKNTEDDIATALINEKDATRMDVPKHKANIGLNADLGKAVSFAVTANWVDKAIYDISDGSGNEYLADVDPYAVLNMKLNYKLSKNTLISLSASNLFNNSHYEYPRGINLPDESSFAIGRLFYGQVKYSF